MTITNWKKFTELGYVMASYTFLRTLETVQAVVLFHIISEYNHAQNNRLELAGFFLTSPARMSNYLGLDKEELFKTLDNLKNFGFIDFYAPSNIENAILICVKEDEIFKFKEKMEDKNLYQDWNTGLLKVQNPINKLKLQHSTEKLKLFVDKHFNKPDCTPAIVLVGCDEVIEKFEENGTCFWDLPNIQDKLVEVLNDEHFWFQDIFILVNDLCKI